jgi:predicted kinase
LSATLTAVVLAGLPGTGKSTLAGLLAEALDAPVLDKDRVRDALFGPRHVSYLRNQDDFVMSTLYAALAHVASSGLARFAVIDGRTFTRAGQFDDLREALERADAELRLIECTCAAQVARQRIASQAGVHVAANRKASLYDELASRVVHLPGPKLVLATDAAPLAELVERAVTYARSREA